jgi:hypothetical protein
MVSWGLNGCKLLKGRRETREKERREKKGAKIQVQFWDEEKRRRVAGTENSRIGYKVTRKKIK